MKSLAPPPPVVAETMLARLFNVQLKAIQLRFLKSTIPKCFGAGRHEVFSGKVSQQSQDEKRPSVERRNDSLGRFKRPGVET